MTSRLRLHYEGVKTHRRNTVVVSWGMTRAALAILASLLIGFGSAPQTPADQQTWRYVEGDRTEGLRPPARVMPAGAAVVTLPHRVMAPNTPLWYWRAMPIPPGSALLVEADDGAQVFVDGARLDHYRRWFFVAEASAPTRRVAVRVMNNAMQGGLRTVRVVTTTAFTTRCDRGTISTCSGRAAPRGLPGHAAVRGWWRST